LDEYLIEIERILPSQAEIHEHMSISLYYRGKVLNKKYGLLRHAYNVFILGLVVGILTFLIFMTVGSEA